MVLCVWTAVHLNIPEHRDHNFKYRPSLQTGRKILWLLVGLFAPEVVSWTAFEQRRQAHALHEQVREALGEKTPCPKSGRLRRWLRWMWKGGEAEKDVEKCASDGHDARLGIGSSVEPSRLSAGLRAPREKNDNEPQRSIQPASALSTTKRSNEWTMTHSYYAVMGMFSHWPEVFI